MLGHLFQSWASIYSNHAALRTAVDFVHIGGLVAGGGCAVAADLATITAAREGPAARETHLALLKRTHSIVLVGLTALVASGVLLFSADVETFLYSQIFWLKMALITVLLVNGALIQRGERQVQRNEPGAWGRLHRSAKVSLFLWALTTLAGAALPNIG